MMLDLEKMNYKDLRTNDLSVEKGVFIWLKAPIFMFDKEISDTPKQLIWPVLEGHELMHLLTACLVCRMTPAEII